MNKFINQYITLNQLEPGMSIAEASKIVGPLFLSVREQGKTLGINEYVSEHVEGLKVFTDPGERVIKIIQASSLEIEGNTVLSIGSRKESILGLFGEATNKKGDSRQYWSYHSLGQNKIGINFIFEGAQLIGISNIDFQALASFKEAKRREQEGL